MGKKIRRRNVLFIFVLSVTCLMSGLSGGGVVKVEAASDKEIILDKGTANEFKVPKDATELVEPELKNNPKFNGYHQSETKTQNFFKENYYINSVSPLSDTYLDIIDIENKKKLALGREQSWSNWEPYSYNAFVAVLNANGKEISRKYFLNGPFYNDKPSEIVLPSIGNLDVVNGKIYAFITDTRDIYKIEISNLGEIISQEKIDKSPASASMINRSSQYISNSIDGKYYGGSGQFLSHSNNDPDWLKNKLVIYNIDMTTTKYTSSLYLELPNLATINPLWGKNGTDNYEIGSNFSSTPNGYVTILHVRAGDRSNFTEAAALVMWDKQGNLKYTGLVDRFKGIQYMISNSNEIFITYDTNEHMVLGKLNWISWDIDEIKSFPKNSDVKFLPMDNNLNDIFMYGTMSEFTDEFLGLGNGDSVIIGSLSSSNYKLKMFSSFQTDIPVWIHDVNLTNKDIILLGQSNGESKESELISPSYIPKRKAKYTNDFSAKLVSKDDFSPALKINKKVSVDITKSKKEMEAELLSGVNVYDSYDLSVDNISGQKNMDWLEKRTNRNPNTLKYDPTGNNIISQANIDWGQLGFKSNQIGPQNVSYFITDSQKQATTSTRWVSGIDDKTIKDKEDDIFLRAQNFSISRKEVSKLTEREARVKGESQAWLGIPEDKNNPFVENMPENKDSRGKVVVDDKQLQKIQNATSSDKAKPYPLDFKYTDEINSKGDTKTITNRIWVFVTNDNTTVDNGVALYADDFTMFLHNAKVAKANDLLKSTDKNTKPNVLVYDYVAQPQTVSKLTPLSDGNVDGDKKGLSVMPASVKKVNGVTGQTTITGVEFTFKENNQLTKVKVTVTIETGMYYLRVRQVISQSEKEIVIPSEGFAQIESLSQIDNRKVQSNILFPSRLEGTGNIYYEITQEIISNSVQEKVKLVVPEYYTYDGYVLSSDAKGQVSTNKKTGKIEFDPNKTPEQWLTIYIKPTTNQPHFYSWGYGH